MATKKKPAPKKASKPAPKKKPVAKKPAAKTAKPAAKAVKKPVAKKPAAKPVAKKPVPKPAPKAVTKPAPKPAPAPAPKVEAPKPVAKKGGIDPKSLVSIKQKVQPVVKKEPPKPSKVAIPKTNTKSAVKYEPDFTKSVLDITAPVYATGPVMRYSDADLTEFREIIQRKLDAAKKELAYLQGLITRKDEGGDMDEARYMTMEDGSVSMEREQLSQMASRQITFIDHLEKAMMRIENKTYGICRVTGKLIDKARLRAVPHATLSIEAKQTMNR
ncbi:MAG TPA: TraR/DksA C4-type zinc finger protein [Chitinophagaceae bacterium]|jgi:RNA polymerase-binding transcription factor DksA|nr:TraR/DksA C4-type zinc finger protein [Chitinophagaceae bacterium]